MQHSEILWYWCMRSASTLAVLPDLKWCAGGDRVAVGKIQVGLLGSARQLQRDLERMTRKANTNTPEGLHYLLQGTPFCRPATAHAVESEPRTPLTWHFCSERSLAASSTPVH